MDNTGRMDRPSSKGENMETTAIFNGPIFTAIVNDPKSETGKRDAEYIPATAIPEDVLKALLGYGVENKRHPWNIPGMSWDFLAGGWRNMKNAVPLDNGIEQQIAFDKDDDRTFFTV